MKYLVVFTLLILVGCGSSTDMEISGTLSWSAPTVYENGDYLSTNNDLEEYRIYYSNSWQSPDTFYEPLSADTTSFKISNLDLSRVDTAETIYIAMTSVSKNGIESQLSDVVQFSP